jgi:hypothetical protein
MFTESERLMRYCRRGTKTDNWSRRHIPWWRFRGGTVCGEVRAAVVFASLLTCSCNHGGPDEIMQRFKECQAGV